MRLKAGRPRPLLCGACALVASIAGSAACEVLGAVLDRLTLLPLPALKEERVILREHRESGVDDRLRHPAPEEEDSYGSSWRREWDGAITPARAGPPAAGQSILAVTPGQSSTTATASAAPGWAWTRSALRDLNGGPVGRRPAAAGGLGCEITRLVVSWPFGILDAHRVELQMLASNSRAINCYLACGFRWEESAVKPGCTRLLERLPPHRTAAVRAPVPGEDCPRHPTR